MAYDEQLANRIREYIQDVPGINIEEKKMFRGLTFMINDKMCVCVSGDNLMCRYDPVLADEVSEKNGFQPMIMKGKDYKGFCYVSPEGISSKKEFKFWMDLCLDFNKRAKSSKKKKTKL
jgi:hypothetical protein